MTDWLPLSLSKKLEDLQALASSPLLASVGSRDLGAVTELCELRTFPMGSLLSVAGSAADGIVVLLDGGAEARDPAGEARRDLHAGDQFGELSVAGPALHEATITATTELRAARLTKARFDALGRSHPAAALRILESVLASIAVQRGAQSRRVQTKRGRVSDHIPPEVDGVLVVGARFEHRTLGLDAVAPAVGVLDPLTVADWEGREIYRRSAGLVLLEAAHRLQHDEIHLGPSWTSGRLILGVTVPDAERFPLARRLNAEIATIIASRTPFCEETWTTDEAALHFRARGWDGAAALCETSAEPSVTLVRCGDVRVPSPGPLLSNTGMLDAVTVLPHPNGISLDFGWRVRRELAPRPFSTVMLEAQSPRYGAEMTQAERRWLDLLGITSVGAFNRACVTGEVGELIHVSEGFHEKRLAALADEVRARPGVRIIAVAGPSSSGKTTFLKRLTIQLEVDGVHPLGLSLDDYYVDRERTVRDEKGEYDYEALEAIDLQLLNEHLERILRGGAVRTAHYDFQSGKSVPEGGHEIALRPSSVLLIEGIHALNPKLFAFAEEGQVFRIFIHPATALPFDPLTSLEPADVRLLRRIVRDRHTRGATAEQNIARWPSVRRGERLHIYPHQGQADCVFDTSLVYEVSVLKVFAERYLLEVPRASPQFSAALRLRKLIAPFVTIYPDHVPPTSMLREFIGGSGFTY